MISSEALYIVDLREGAPEHLTDEQLRAFERQARNGDARARETLILHCVGYIARIAGHLGRLYQCADGYLELVAVGNLAVVERVDRALAEAAVPTRYLCAVAKWKIRWHCLFRGLITLPENDSYLQHRASVSSIDALREMSHFDIEAPSDTTNANQEEDAALILYGPLRAILLSLVEKLPSTQRHVIVRHYGLDGNPPETLADINKRMSKSGGYTAHNYFYRALQELRVRALRKQRLLQRAK